MKRGARSLFVLIGIAVSAWQYGAALLANAQEGPSSQAVVIAPLSAQPSATPSALPPLPPSSQILEIPLPQTFAGCWSAQVDHADKMRSNHWFYPDFLVRWWPKKYKLCFRRVGSDEWSITYGSTELNPQTGIFSGWMQTAPSQVTAWAITDGGAGARITIKSTYDFAGTGFVKHETAHLKCHPTTGTAMYVEGAMESTGVNGNGIGPSGTWHAEFARTSTDDADAKVDSGTQR